MKYENAILQKNKAYYYIGRFKRRGSNENPIFLKF